MRFALAQTGLLDTDALELDKLNFSVGRNSNVEFRDVGLRLEVCSAHDMHASFTVATVLMTWSIETHSPAATPTQH